MKFIHPLVAIACSFAVAAPNAPAAEPDRTILPIKEPLPLAPIHRVKPARLETILLDPNLLKRQNPSIPP